MTTTDSPHPAPQPAWMRRVHDNLDEWERYIQTEFRRELRGRGLVQPAVTERYSYSFRADTDGWGE